MSLSEDLLASADVGVAFATALEAELGDEWLLTAGVARTSIVDVVGDESSRVVAAHFGMDDDQEGTLALVAIGSFAETLERAASDEILVTSSATTLEAAARSIGEVVGLSSEIDRAEETELASLTAQQGDRAVVVYPVLDGTEVVACLVVFLGAASSASHPNIDSTPGDARAALAAAGSVGGSFVLADVEMGVTAELGRTSMSMRELLSITPGAVIDLDRAASAPVDVLVNGTLIARGEVVVIEEEFGIRISEILPEGSQAH